MDYEPTRDSDHKRLLSLKENISKFEATHK